MAFSVTTACKNKSPQANQAAAVVNDNPAPDDTESYEDEVLEEEEEDSQVVMYRYTRQDSVFGYECKSRVILRIKDRKMKAIAVNCSFEYTVFDFFEGIIEGSNSTGRGYYFDNCGGPLEGPTMCMNEGDFNMTLSNDLNKLYLNDKRYSRAKFRYRFRSSRFEVFAEPDFNATVLQETNDEKLPIELLDIGDLDKRNGEWDVWLKIRTPNGVGWCFGNMAF
jgi:hypothetical protein